MILTKVNAIVAERIGTVRLSIPKLENASNRADRMPTVNAIVINCPAESTALLKTS